MFAGAATLGAEHLVVLAAAAPALGSLTTTLPSAHPCNSQQVARSTYPEHRKVKAKQGKKSFPLQQQVRYNSYGTVCTLLKPRSARS